MVEPWRHHCDELTKKSNLVRQLNESLPLINKMINNLHQLTMETPWVTPTSFAANHGHPDILEAHSLLHRAKDLDLPNLEIDGVNALLRRRFMSDVDPDPDLNNAKSANVRLLCGFVAGAYVELIQIKNIYNINFSHSVYLGGDNESIRNFADSRVSYWTRKVDELAFSLKPKSRARALT